MSQQQTLESKVTETLTALQDALGHKITPKVWYSSDRTFARIYTGHKGEYLQVNPDLTVERSRTNMTWGHIIREVVETI